MLILLPLITIIIILFSTISYSLFDIVRVTGQSMLPTIHDGDYLIVLRKFPASFLNRGGLVIVAAPNQREITFTNNAQKFVKRITGIPGDKLEADPNRVANETTFQSSEDSEVRKYWLIPEGYYFLSSDNTQGVDSRMWGLVREQFLVGRVIIKLPRSISSF